jgi:hypothetical protein
MKTMTINEALTFSKTPYIHNVKEVALTITHALITLAIIAMVIYSVIIL